MLLGVSYLLLVCCLPPAGAVGPGLFGGWLPRRNLLRDGGASNPVTIEGKTFKDYWSDLKLLCYIKEDTDVSSTTNGPNTASSSSPSTSPLEEARRLHERGQLADRGEGRQELLRYVLAYK